MKRRMAKIAAVALVVLGSLGAAVFASNADCCCDFSGETIVCRITGERLDRCCCDQSNIAAVASRPAAAVESDAAVPRP